MREEKQKTWKGEGMRKECDCVGGGAEDVEDLLDCEVQQCEEIRRKWRDEDCKAGDSE